MLLNIYLNPVSGFHIAGGDITIQPMQRMISIFHTSIWFQTHMAFNAKL